MKLWKIRKPPQQKDKVYEECVLCHELTDVRLDLPVEWRQYYVHSVGQLCEKCYHKTYCEAGE